MTEYIKRIREKIGHDRLIIAGAGVIIYKDGKVLLQKRNDNLTWSLHGGCVEVGERVYAAAKRELFEETGLTANNMTLYGVYSGEEMLYTYPNGDEVFIVGTIYFCTDFSGEMICETNETLALEWFSVDALPKEINPPDIQPLMDLQAYLHNKKI